MAAGTGLFRENYNRGLSLCRRFVTMVSITMCKDEILKNSNRNTFLTTGNMVILTIM